MQIAAAVVVVVVVVVIGPRIVKNPTFMWLEDLGTNGADVHCRNTVQDAAYASTSEWLFRHGGRCGKRITLSDLVGYSLKDKEWTSISTAGVGASVAQQSQPPSRSAHCAIALSSSNSLVLHGGKNEDGAVCSELWACRLNCHGGALWECLDDYCGGCQPPKMYGHSIILASNLQSLAFGVGEDACFVVGVIQDRVDPTRRAKRRRDETNSAQIGAAGRIAVYLLTLGSQLEWREISCSNFHVVPPRRNFKLVESDSGHVLLLGGSSGSRFEHTDVWAFHPWSGQWREILCREYNSGVPLAPCFLRGVLKSAILPLMVQVGQRRAGGDVSTATSVLTGVWLAVSHQQCCLLRMRARSTLAAVDPQSVLEVFPCVRVRELQSGRFRPLAYAVRVRSSLSPLAAIQNALPGNVNSADGGDAAEGEDDVVSVVVVAGMVSSGAVFRLTLGMSDLAPQHVVDEVLHVEATDHQPLDSVDPAADDKDATALEQIETALEDENDLLDGLFDDGDDG